MYRNIFKKRYFNSRVNIITIIITIIWLILMPYELKKRSLQFSSCFGVAEYLYSCVTNYDKQGRVIYSKFSLKTINRYIKSVNKSTLINSFVIFVIVTILGIPIIHNIFCLLPYVYDMYGKTTVYLGMYKGIFASIIFMILSYIINKFE